MHWRGFSQKNLLSSGTGGKLRNMARPDYHPHPQALPQFGQNADITEPEKVGIKLN
jgi:hypothetical protein